MTPKQTANEHAAATVIQKLARRNISGSYAPTAADAVAQIKNILQAGMTVANGGSETLGALDFRAVVEQAGCTYLDRASATTPQEARELYAKTTLCDVFFMSTNAITADGELLNVDGAGNRVSCLAFGPSKVVVVAGMNKLCKDLHSAMDRVRVTAAPPNCVRLNLNTPCAATGICGDCHSPDCICCQVVITRHSRVPGRIHVILVGEELGY